MAIQRCHRCGATTPVLDDEWGMHECMWCGYFPDDHEGEYDDRDQEQPIEFADDDEEAKYKWARAYDELNGAPENEGDR